MLRASVFRRKVPRYDAVILAEFSIEMFFFSWVLARRARAIHVVDFFVGLYETEVEDSKRTRPRSFRAVQLSAADRGAALLADVCLTDTRTRAVRFERKFGSRTPFVSLPVGAPRWAWALPQMQTVSERPREVRFLFYGNYLALHGLEKLVKSIEWLSKRVSPSEMLFTLLGSGPQREKVGQLVRHLRLEAWVNFEDPLPPDQLGAVIRGSDVVLGIFGSSPKAESVIANKVWQGLAAGKIVLTRASPALAEIESLVPVTLIQVEDTSPPGLGRSLLAAADLARRAPVQDLAPVLERYVEDQFEIVFGRILGPVESGI